MRINLGIRRRLAPLLDNDRRKIELMNALLFSMPGTPVIYYGDEIGMGDNIYLGDRDGVRTPMQWSPTATAASPAPTRSGSICRRSWTRSTATEAVNVESQVTDRSSLLNWMPADGGAQAAPGLRPRHHDVRLSAQPQDPGLLARARGRHILCVFNLSRAAQAVELDLAAFKGRVPIELLGRSPFPPIGDLPYMLTCRPTASTGSSWPRRRICRSGMSPSPNPCPNSPPSWCAKAGLTC
jgi:maltose alpha-D-glucosyltransferase / alpha-amylase